MLSSVRSSPVLNHLSMVKEEGRRDAVDAKSSHKCNFSGLNGYDNGDILNFPDRVLTPGGGGERLLESLIGFKLPFRPRHSDLSLSSKSPIESLESDSPQARGRFCPQIIYHPPGQLSKCGSLVVSAPFFYSTGGQMIRNFMSRVS